MVVKDFIPDDVFEDAVQHYRFSKMTVPEIADYLTFRHGARCNVRIDASKLRNKLTGYSRTFHPHDEQTAALMGTLQSLKTADDMFFFDFINEEGTTIPRYVCFAFGEWQRWFQKYGVAMCVDAKGGTNRFNMPCLSFIGTTPVGASVPFFFALLREESAMSFQWAMRSFLRCYADNAPPNVVYTDHDRKLIDAIVSTIPAAKVRLDSWHLNQNIRKHLASKPEIRKELEKLRHCRDIAEALELGERFAREHPETASWFTLWWEDREHWIAAWLSVTEARFSALLNGTNRVEGFNSVLEDLFGDMRTPLDEMPAVIGKQNSKLAERIGRMESARVQKGWSKHLWQCAPHVTKYAFDRFLEREFQHCENWTCTRAEDQQDTWRVTHTAEGCAETVHIDRVALKATCTCTTIPRHGIGCRHVMRVLMAEQTLDSRILLNLFHEFWRIDRAAWDSIAARRPNTGAMCNGLRGPEESDHVPSGPQLYHDIMHLSKTIAFAVADKSEETRTEVLHRLRELLDTATDPAQRRRRGRPLTMRVSAGDETRTKRRGLPPAGGNPHSDS
jgi:hypothetical protein